MLEGKTKFALTRHKGHHTQIDFCTHLHTPFVSNMIFHALTFKRPSKNMSRRVRVWPNISFVVSSVHKTPIALWDQMLEWRKLAELNWCPGQICARHYNRLLCDEPFVCRSWKSTIFEQTFSAFYGCSTYMVGPQLPVIWTYIRRHQLKLTKHPTPHLLSPPKIFHRCYAFDLSR